MLKQIFNTGINVMATKQIKTKTLSLKERSNNVFFNLILFETKSHSDGVQKHKNQYNDRICFH